MRVKTAISVVNATENLVLAELRERRTSLPGDGVLFCCEACDQDVAAPARRELAGTIAAAAEVVLKRPRHD